MGKTAFIFPGQGAQYVGMAQEFYEQIPASRKVFRLASEASGLDIPSLCFEKNDKLHITEYTQICMLTAEAAILEALREAGYAPDVAAGLSLGEYGALMAADVMEWKEAFALVRKRGIYMQEAVPTGGAMTAVMGLDADKIEEICRKMDGIVSVANYNCPGQIVITGQKMAVEAVGISCKEAGAKRIIPLNVSGPFHSELLTEAGEKLGEALKDVEIKEFSVPYVSNVLAEYVREPSAVKELLRLQVSSPVRWQQSVEYMLQDGVEEFIEIGPGRTLSGFIRKMTRDAKLSNIDKMEDFEKFITEHPLN